MIRRILNLLGAVALLGLVLGSIAALAIVKQRVHVTVALDAPRSPGDADRLAELEQDVADVKQDLESLAAALEQNLSVLAADLQTADEETTQEVARQLAQTNAEVARVLVAIEQLRIEGADAEPSPPPPRPPAEIVASAPDALAESLAADPPAAPSAAPPARKRFLQFELPSSSFAFDRRQSLTLLPSLSRVGFDAKSTLHDFSGVTSRIDGALEVDLSRPEAAPRGRIDVDVASLDTGLAGRDEEMREVLAAQEHPRIRFEWTAFAASDVDAATRTVAGTARGELTIRGRTLPISMPVKVSIDASRRVVIEGEARLAMSSFGIPVPSQLGLISVEDEVRIWIALRARAAPVAPTAAAKSEHEK